MKREKLPEVERVFESKEDLDVGQAHARSVGHKHDTRKFKVTSQDGEVTKFVLGYSPANAASRVWEDMGIQVEEIDPANKVLTMLRKMPEDERTELLAEFEVNKRKKK